MEKEYNKFAESDLFEGMTSIRAVIKSFDEKNSDRKIMEILFDESRAEARYKELNYLSKISTQYGFVLTKLSAEEINNLAIGNSHGGILARCSSRTIPSLLDTPIESLPENGFYVMLDGIEDPYNFGYSLRSLYAAGVDGVILNERNWMGAAGVVSRASAGASEMLDMFIASGEDAADVFKSIDYKIICAGIRNSVSIYEADMKKPVFLIIGGEKRGISSAVLQKADQIVRIDYDSKFRGSLSAASSSAIIGFEIMHQNKFM